jgi:transcriptional regulator GlxA family with amidase domain
VTAGLDLALSLVEEDLGHATAMQIARHFVMYMKRPGGQAQFSANLRAQINGTGPIGDICDFILKNLDQDLSVPTLADRAAMSPRHFYRRFSAEMDMAPAAFVAAARLELARELLETSALAIEIVARRAGFSSAEQLRRALSRRMGATPRIYRSRFSTPDHNPPHFPQQRTHQS